MISDPDFVQMKIKRQANMAMFTVAGTLGVTTDLAFWFAKVIKDTSY